MEVDIVMSADTPLWKAHDISQTLQDKIESLPGVERAFVHVDHETTHMPVRFYSPSSIVCGRNFLSPRQFLGTSKIVLTLVTT